MLRSIITALLFVCSVTFVSLGQQPSAPSAQSPSAQTEPSAGSPHSASHADQATVYFYRYKQYAGSALKPSVYCDEVQVARMDNGRYFTLKLDPGKHTFRSNDKQSGAEVDLKPGQEYFLRVELVAGFMKGHGRLVAVVAEQAKYELKAKNLKPLDADNVTDKARVSIEPVQFAEGETSK
jgi:hypothetical protein